MVHPFGACAELRWFKVASSSKGKFLVFSLGGKKVLFKIIVHGYNCHMTHASMDLGKLNFGGAVCGHPLNWETGTTSGL